MVKPSFRRKMAQQAVAQYAVSIRLACAAFGISETCYRYQAKLSDDNALIAEQLIELTEENTDQVERWVGNISKGFGNEYMFTF